MNEETFLNSIDCCFPYEDESQWRKLILQGKSISENASFGVLEEISRKSSGSQVSEQQQLAMLDCWRAENKHVLAEYVIEAAKAIITGKPLPITTVLDYMDKVQDHKNQFCALNIISFACDDMDGFADEKWQNIIESWKKQD